MVNNDKDTNMGKLFSGKLCCICAYTPDKDGLRNKATYSSKQTCFKADKMHVQRAGVSVTVLWQTHSGQWNPAWPQYLTNLTVTLPVKNRLSWLKRTRLSFRKKTKRMVSVTFSMSTFTVSVMIDRSSASSHGVTEQKVRENSTRQTLESGHFTVGLRWFGLFLYDCKKGVLQHWRKLTALENEAKVHRYKLHVINFCWYRYVQREFELFWRCLPTVTTVIRRCFHTFEIFTFGSILARSRLSR